MKTYEDDIPDLIDDDDDIVTPPRIGILLHLHYIILLWDYVMVHVYKCSTSLSGS